MDNKNISHSILKKNSIIIILLICILSITKISGETQVLVNKKNINSDIIGTIEIKKINLKEQLYKKESKKNNIEENITILQESTYPSNENSILIIAAHSGTGKIAYFERLDELSTNDEIIITYNKKKYYYNVIDIFEEKKNGYININKEKKRQLVLTTCSPTKDNIQLIVNCIEKES